MRSHVPRAQWGQPLMWRVPGWQDKNLHSWPKAILPLAHPSLPELRSTRWHLGIILRATVNCEGTNKKHKNEKENTALNRP